MVLEGTIVLAAFVLSAFVARRCSQPRSKLYISERITDRSMHRRPVSRSGGIAILAAIVISLGIYLLLKQSWDCLCTLSCAVAISIVGGIGLLDDRSPRPVATKLVAQCVAAAFLAAGGLVLVEFSIPGWTLNVPPAIGAVLTMLFIVYAVNMYNFMDGVDGLAATMSATGFGVLALLGLAGGSLSYALANMVVASASIGFLVFNFPPARLFMGDGGSYTLGVLMAVSTVWGVRDDIFPLWASLLAFSPFFVDSFVTLALRALRRESLLRPHCDHFYQRVVRLGFGSRRVLLGALVVMAGAAASALLSAKASLAWQWGVVLFWLLFYAAAMCGIATHERKVRNASR
jgi:UDP-N-acetylmuramyl pentapeptide phosphotransferase/UDP-N-acetylglucosamine-1-phosphate transferase